MTADEIRNWPITERDIALNEPFRVGIDQAELIRELAAQVAELNESRKPRWVNFPTFAGPRLIDAKQVVGLSSGHTSNGMESPSPCAYIRLRGSMEPFVVADMDHDEVRFRLGIDEDWLNPPKLIRSRTVSEADYAEMIAIIDAARNLAHDHALVSTSTGAARENLTKLDTLFDSFDSMPF